MAFWVAPAIAATVATGQMLAQMKANADNAKAQGETNELDMDMFNRQMDYTKSVQAETWRRDDTALQRTVYDAQTAGLSPLAALGGSSNSQVVSQPQAAHLQPARYDSVMSGVNLDSIGDAIIAGERLKVDQQNANTAREKMLNDKEKADADRAQDRDLTLKSLEQNDLHFQTQINTTQSNKDREFYQGQMEFNKTLQHSIRVQDFNEKINYQKTLIDEIDSAVREVRGKTGDVSGSFTIIRDKAKYEAAMSAWANRYADFVAVNYSASKRSGASAESRSGNSGINLGLGSNESSYQGGSYGANKNVGANFGMGRSDYQSESLDFTFQDKQKFAAWLAKNPMPVYRPGF